MSRDSIDIELDTASFERKLKRFARKMPKRADQATEASAVKLHDSIQNDWLNRAGSGRTYNVKQKAGATGSTHTASKPGEPPAAITSVYRNSWQRRRIANMLHRVSTGDERGPLLEYGTRTMGERPHARPAAKEHEDEHRKIFIEAIKAFHT